MCGNPVLSLSWITCVFLVCHVS